MGGRDDDFVGKAERCAGVQRFALPRGVLFHQRVDLVPRRGGAEVHVVRVAGDAEPGLLAHLRRLIADHVESEQSQDFGFLQVQFRPLGTPETGLDNQPLR